MGLWVPNRQGSRGRRQHEVVFIPEAAGNTNLAASGNGATMSTPSQTNVATGFATATAYSSSGFNTDHVGVIDFVLNKVGSWLND